MRAGGEQRDLAPTDADLARPEPIGDEAARLARPAEVKQRALGSKRQCLIAGILTKRTGRALQA
jgi:hypothetical protein